MAVSDPWRWPDGAPAAVTITFDGGYRETVRNVEPILERHGIRPTWFLVAGAIGHALEGRPVAGWDYWTQLGESGEVANHTLTHPVLRSPRGAWRRDVLRPRRLAGRVARRLGLRPGEPRHIRGEQTNRRVGSSGLVKDAIEGKELLEDRIGHSVVSFAYPSGRGSTAVAEHLVRAGHTSLRTTRSSINDPEEIDLRSLGARVWTRSTDEQTADRWIAEAIDEKGWQIEVHHLVGWDGHYEWSTPPEVLDAHLQRVVESGAWIATQRDVVEYLARHGKGLR